MRKFRAYSGAADKISYHIGHAYKEHQTLTNFYDVDASVGTSSGAIMELGRMCGDMEKIKNIALNFNVKNHILGVNPTSLMGIATASKNLAFGKTDGFFEFKKLPETIKSVTSESKFNWYKDNINKPVYVGVTNKYGMLEYRDLNRMSYQTAIKNVLKSSTIPVFIKSIDSETDGGLVDHIGTKFLIEDEYNGYVQSIFAREDKLFIQKKPKRIISSLLWTMDRLTHNLSIDDETIIDDICLRNNMINDKYFMTEKVIDGIFKIKKGDNEKLFNMGYNLK